MRVGWEIKSFKDMSSELSALTILAERSLWPGGVGKKTEEERETNVDWQNSDILNILRDISIK